MSTQKEWELETRIKHLEGNSLECIYSDYEKAIDKIFNKAINDLDEIELPRYEAKEERPPYELISLAELARRQQSGFYELDMRYGWSPDHISNRTRLAMGKAPQSAYMGFGALGGLGLSGVFG